MDSSLKNLTVLGLNHDTCPVDLRENIAFDSAQVADGLLDITKESNVSEATILSTCNRTEIYVVGPNNGYVMDWLCGYKNLDVSKFSSGIYSHVGTDAVRHIFRVASGLDSMVIGETQILGQLKVAGRIAERVGSLGPLLRQTLDMSFSVAKNVRSNTKIGANSISLPAAAMKVSRRIFGTMEDSSILFLGAGEMIRLSAEYFSQIRVKEIVFTNRTYDRAKKLAKDFHGQAFPLEYVTEHLKKFDVIIACTGSQLPIIGKGMVEHSIRARRFKPMLFVDLAVPRNIEPEISKLKDIFLYSIDDLGSIVMDGKNQRAHAAIEAEKYLADGLIKFEKELFRKQASPLIKLLWEHGEKIVESESEKALDALAKGADPSEVVSAVSRSIMKKILHSPSHALSTSDVENRERLSKALCEFFNLKS